MSSIDKELISSLRKIKFRICRNLIIDQLIWGAIVGLCCGSLVCIAALLIPLYKVNLIIYKLIAVGIGIALISSFIRIPKNKEIAYKADELGLKERMSTSIELIGKEDGFAQLLKKDAISKLEQLDYKHELNYILKRKQIIIFIISIIIILGSIFIRTPAKTKAEEKYKFQIMQEDETKNIVIEEEILNKSSSLSKEDKEALLNSLTSLKKEIKEAKSISEIENSLTKFQIETEEMKQKYSEKDLNNVVSGLSKNESTSNLAQAVQSGNKEAISQAINNLPESLKNASSQDVEDIAKNFAQMAKNSEDEDLKKSLSDITEKLSSNNPDKFNNLGDLLKNFNKTIQKPLDNRDAKNQIKGIQKDLKSDSNSINNQTQPVSNNNSSPQDTTSNTSGTVINDKSDGEQPGNSENGKIDNNTSSGNIEENNQSGLNKKGSSDGKQEENVYTLPSQDTQGSTVPAKPQSLDKVIGKYKEKAYENMNSSIIPEGMKDIIKGYFTSLEQ